MDFKTTISFKNATVIALATAATLTLSSCNFQPLYNSPDATVGSKNIALSNISVANVDNREGQQVRNHLIFLLSGGVTPAQPSHEVRLRVTSSEKTLASSILGSTGNAPGKTTGSVLVTVSYELFDIRNKTFIATGRRVASAAYDNTSQSFANFRVNRDATNRAAREAAELVRLAISSDLIKS